MSRIELSVFGCDIRIECMDDRAESLVRGNYGSLKNVAKDPRVFYRITRGEASEGLLIERNGSPCPMLARDDYDFLYMLEKDVTIETQKLRPDLFFVHAAILELDGHSMALVAPSGHGKSTTAWGLLHYGFKYVSDELAPIDLTTIRVHPFPHALCLKSLPPNDFPLPDETIFTAYTAHVPTDCLPSQTALETLPLRIIFFLRFEPENSRPVLKPAGKAEATVQLLRNALNPLAHQSDGLDAAIRIVSNVHCFELLSSNLQLTCELIKSSFRNTFSAPR